MSSLRCGPRRLAACIIRDIIATVERVVVLGRGGSGKSTAALRLAQITGLPVIELDKHFWSSDLRPLSGEEWARVTSDLAARPRWIMDGDLGPYNVLGPRLHRADTVLILDYGLLRCVWRALRRSPEKADFWWWVLAWRRRSRPILLRAIAEHAPTATCYIVKKPKDLASWFCQLEQMSG